MYTTRGEKLIASYQLQKFNSELKELLDWIQEVKGQMEIGDLPKNLAEAESLIEEHQEIKASIIISAGYCHLYNSFHYFKKFLISIFNT